MAFERLWVPLSRWFSAVFAADTSHAGDEKRRWVDWRWLIDGSAESNNNPLRTPTPPFATEVSRMVILGHPLIACRWIMKGKDSINCFHRPLTTDSTKTGVVTQFGEVRIQISNIGFVWIGEPDQFPATRQRGFAQTVDKKTVITHAPETRRQYMIEESTDKFIGGQCHDLVGITAVVMIVKADHAIVDALDAVVGDGDSIDVTPQIADQVFRLIKRLLGVHNPWMLIERAAPCLPIGVVC